jgi:two-component system, NtrC family, sensor histidine kinase HydH
VRLEVRDTGVGMSREQVEKMFEPLFTTKARGIGLGLAVSRSLVQANGGQISAVSEPGKGSTLSVDLPADKAA